MNTMDLVQEIVSNRYKSRYMVTKAILITEVVDKSDPDLGRKLIVNTPEETTLWDGIGMLATVNHDMLSYYANIEPEYPDE